MKQNDVHIGRHYLAKVGDRVVPVRIDRVSPHGGWDATNVTTGRAVRIKTAGRLRCPCNEQGQTLPGLFRRTESPFQPETIMPKTKTSKATKTTKSTKRTPPFEVTDITDRVPQPAPGKGQRRRRDPDAVTAEVPIGGADEGSVGGEPVAATADPAATAVIGSGFADAMVAAVKQTRGRKSNAEKPVKDKKLSALDAAAQVLADSATPMNCTEMIQVMAERGLWSSPAGRTPSATLYSAILREVTTKGAAARFRKAERGRFERNPS